MKFMATTMTMPKLWKFFGRVFKNSLGEISDAKAPNPRIKVIRGKLELAISCNFSRVIDPPIEIPASQCGRTSSGSVRSTCPGILTPNTMATTNRTMRVNNPKVRAMVMAFRFSKLHRNRYAIKQQEMLRVQRIQKLVVVDAPTTMLRHQSSQACG